MLIHQIRVKGASYKFQALGSSHQQPMNHITIPITPSSEDIQSLRNLFKKYSVEKPGVLSMQEINLLILELVNKPEPFQIQELFGAFPSLLETGVDENTFLVWYLSVNISVPMFYNLFLMLRTLQKQIESAAPFEAGKESVKESFLKFSSETNQEHLSNQVYFDILLNPTKSKARLDKYQEVIKKEFSSFAICLSIQVNGSPHGVKDQVQALINHLKEFAREMLGPSEGFLDLINIHVGSNESQVLVVVDSDFLPFRLVGEQFERVMKGFSPTIYAETSVLIRSDSLGKILGSSHEGLNASLAFDLKIDSVLLQKIKDHLQKVRVVPESIHTVLFALLEEVRIDIKTNNLKQHLVQTFGLPNISLTSQAQNIKEQVNISEMMEMFLPESSKELVKTIKNAESSNVTLDLFWGCLNVRANFCLSGTKEVFESIL